MTDPKFTLWSGLSIDGHCIPKRKAQNVPRHKYMH